MTSTTDTLRKSWRWRAIAVVAAAGLAVGACGGDDDDDASVSETGTEDPVDTVTSTPTTAAAAAPAQDAMHVAGSSDGFSELEPGPYFIDPDGDDTPLRVTYQVAAEGWGAWFGAVKFTDPGATTVSITPVTNLVTDGCLDQTPLEPAVGPTVDDLATALTQLEPFEVTAPPTDVTLFGYPGKHLELTVPDSGIADCVNGELHSWISPLNGGAFYGYKGPGETEEFWNLDVEGTRLVLVKDASPDTSAQDLHEADAIFDTIQIEP